MRRFLPLLLGACLALPLLADDPPADAPPPPPEPEIRQEPAVPQDSALVAAAKRNGRGRMPAKVITNKTVKASKGHLTTTKTQRPIDLAATAAPPPPKPAAKAKPGRKKAGTETAEKREEQKAATAAAAEEGMYDGVEDDPAQTEHAAEEAQKPPG
jgi:hypothetical protein